ncbi:MAG TPA: recombinase family protein [Microvirga sp.]|jgi:DNA invertase Pin-like site-specific DNA recombinase|nr:recombinase family protein [Microvirga sp.]
MRDRGQPQRVRELRCAVYTRKSSEEGLEQDFNSLHAQREACEAYVKSQVHEGWRVIPTAYDDGGYSGGSMERPGLTRLLADVASGLVDVVVVYKVDRLTRSLTDFARIVEVFDQRGVSFVSVTQSFNTTSSMGRLTLNVLLSFAQFEREVTGERIRDKIAASKKKGLWMGGCVPLGYEADGRTLKVNEGEAETVRTIYRLYLELGSVDFLREALERQGVRTKVRTGQEGSRGGGIFSRGHLYRVLQNPLYIGRISHKGQVYDGQHAAIIDVDTWERVQATLSERGREHRVRGKARQPSLLANLLFDEEGVRLTCTHAVKDGKRYRYYVRAAREGEGRGRAWRLPAHELESVVLDQLRERLADQHWISTVLSPWQPTPGELHEAFGRAGDHLSILQGPTAGLRESLLTMVRGIEVSAQEVRIEMRASALLARAGEGERAGEEQSLEIVAPAALRRSGNESRMIVPGVPRGSSADPALVKAIARGHTWFEELATGRAATVAEIAAREEVSDRYVSCLLRLAFLPPAAVERLINCQVATGISTKHLTLDLDLPLDWVRQEALLRLH